MSEEKLANSVDQHVISGNVEKNQKSAQVAKNQKTLDVVKKVAMTGLMAALCYVGYAVFPAITASGTKIHLGNAFVVLGALLLGGGYGGIAGAVGLTLADIIGGYVTSAPRTFITKLVIGLIVGLVAHKFGHIKEKHSHGYVLGWSIAAAAAGLGFNCVFEPSLKYVWYTFLFVNPDKAASAIKALVAITTYTTFINAFINSILAVILYNALRPALKKAGLGLFED